MGLISKRKILSPLSARFTELGDVSFTDPADGQFYKYDSASGLFIPTKRIDNPQFNEAVAMTKTSTQLNYVDDHDTRHRFGGADQLSINRLMVTIPSFFFHNIAGYSSTQVGQVGTGSSWVFPNITEVSSGTTSGGTCGRRLDITPWLSQNVEFRWTWGFEIMLATLADKAEVWGGMFNNSATFPSGNAARIAFKFISTGDGVNPDCVFTVANGAAESVYTVDTNCGQWYCRWFMIIYGYSASALWVDLWKSTDGRTYTLVTQITSNIPYDLGVYPEMWVKSSENENKAARMFDYRQLGTDVE